MADRSRGIRLMLERTNDGLGRDCEQIGEGGNGITGRVCGLCFKIGCFSIEDGFIYEWCD